MKAQEARELKNKALEDFHNKVLRRINEIYSYMDIKIRETAVKGGESRRFSLKELIPFAFNDNDVYPRPYLDTINAQLLCNEICEHYEKNGFSTYRKDDGRYSGALSTTIPYEFTIKW